MRTVTVLVLLSLAGVSSYAAKEKSAKPAAAKTAKKSTVVKKPSKTPGGEFKKVVTESDQNYAKAGKAAGKGTKSLGKKTKDGNLLGGMADFGKGVGKGGKEITVGTAKAGKHAGLGIKNVFVGGGKNSK